MTEMWKAVVGFEGKYEVSNHGRVRGVDRSWIQKTKSGSYYLHKKKGILLKPGIASNNYPTVALGRGNTRTVHSLVAEAFIGPCPMDEEVRHKDGNRRNPIASNLHYGTRTDNIFDAIEHGTWFSPARIAHLERFGRHDRNSY